MDTAKNVRVNRPLKKCSQKCQNENVKSKTVNTQFCGHPVTVKCYCCIHLLIQSLTVGSLLKGHYS